VTNKDVFNAAEISSKAVDAAPTGTGAILKGRASKDWMETSVLRAISKLDAASYHCANVARLVQSGQVGSSHPPLTTRSLGSISLSQMWPFCFGSGFGAATAFERRSSARTSF
jgi:hypothetical protein